MSYLQRGISVLYGSIIGYWPKQQVLFLKCFTGPETWYEGSNQCELIEIASKIIEIGAKLSVGRQIESEEVKCLISGRLTS